MITTDRSCLFACILFFVVAGCVVTDKEPRSTRQQLEVQDNLVVIVDPTVEAYTVVISVEAQKRAKIEKDRPGEFQYFSVKQFSEAVTEIIDPRILENAYSTDNFYSNLVELVVKYPDTPIGVTWHGGIAITRNDFQHSERMLGIWKNDKGQFLNIQNKSDNVARDPTNPDAHFGPLLK